MRKVDFVICITIFTEATLLSVKIQESNFAVVECIMEIIKACNLTLNKTSMYLSEDSALSTGILKGFNHPVVINLLDDNKNSDLVITLNSNISSILNLLSWNPQTHFITVHDDKEKCKETVVKFWKNYAANTFGLVKESDHVFVYTFLPNSNCGEGEFALYNTWRNGRFLYKFKKKKGITVKDMKGCHVNISVFDDVKPAVILESDKSDKISGIEGKIMSKIVMKLHLKATYALAPDGKGWGYIKPTPSGVVGEVFMGRSEIAFGLLAPTLERFKYLDMSTPYDDRECVTFGVPKGAGPHDPTWLRILTFEFSPFVWTLIVILFIFMVTILWFLKKRKARRKMTPEQLVSYVCMAFLATPIKIPIHYGSFFKIMFVSYVWCSYILVVAYQSSLGSQMTIPSPNPDIETLDELADSGFKITGYDNFKIALEYEGMSPSAEKIMKKFLVTNTDIEKAVESVAEGKESHMRQKTTFLYYMRKNWSMRGRVYLIPDCTLSYFPVFVLRKNSPFTKEVNRIISNLAETGITRHWRREYIPIFKKRKPPYVRLSIDHILGAITFATAGWSISVLAFVLEICYNYYKTKTDDVGKNYFHIKTKSEVLYELSNRWKI